VLAALPPPGARASIVVAEDDAELAAALAGSSWAGVPRVDVLRAAGRHEGVGGFAFVAACARVLAGEVECALVLGVPRGRTYGLVVARR